MASKSKSASNPGLDRRQTEAFQQAHEAIHNVGADPAQPMGQPALGDHADGHGLAVLESPAITGNRLDRVADRVAEVQHGAETGLLALVAGDDARP